MYKALGDSELCVNVLTLCFQRILHEEQKITGWEISNTNMLPKISKPKSGDLRPIALTDVSYKLFMNLNGTNIDQHVIKNGERKYNQGGFSKGSQIEDNLFILQYCIESSFKAKKPLIVISVDFSKAFDSIKREKIIEALMKYKVHPKIITAISNIYTDDKTIIKFGSVETEIKITSGIRRGCTGSTILFKLIT